MSIPVAIPDAAAGGPYIEGTLVGCYNQPVTFCPRCRRGYDDGVRFCPVDGSPIPQTPGAADAYLGQTLMGQFQIESLAGRGAMGTVYRATQTNMARTVAVKVLRRDLLEDRAAISRFLREARAAARLSHPNIVTVHLVGETHDAVPYIVMEFVDGGALDALIEREGVLEPHRALRIARQIASALAEAHAHGIVHRDLKPDNILLLDKPRAPDLVKVLDFGIAKILRPDASATSAITRDGTIFGTPHYIAPEQAGGYDVDARADIYSLGVILFRMTTGRLPFEGASGMQVLMRHMRELPPRPRSLRPELPAAVESIILRCLEKDRAERYQDAEEVIAAIDEAEVHVDDDPSRTIHGVAPPARERAVPPPSPRPGSGAASTSGVTSAAAAASAVAEASGRLGPPRPAVIVDGPEAAGAREVTNPDRDRDDLPADQTAEGRFSARRATWSSSALDDGDEDDAELLAAARRPSRRLAMYVGVGAVLVGGGIGLLYAVRAAESRTPPAVAARPAPATPAAPPVAAAPLYEEHVTTDGAFALRVGFLAPPRDGELVRMRLSVSDAHGPVAGAHAAVVLADRAGRDESLPLVETAGAYVGDVRFASAGRTPLRLAVDTASGGRARAIVPVDVAAAPAPAAPRVTQVVRARHERSGRAAGRSSPVRIGAPDEDDVDPATLPVTVVTPDSPPVVAPGARTPPRALGPAPEAGGNFASNAPASPPPRAPAPTVAPQPAPPRVLPPATPSEPAAAGSDGDPYKILEGGK